MILHIITNPRRTRVFLQMLNSFVPLVASYLMSSADFSAEHRKEDATVGTLKRTIFLLQTEKQEKRGKPY